MSVVKDEPVLSATTIVTIATAAVGLVVAFWPGLLTDQQQDAILVLVGVVAPVVVGMVVRGKVTPNANVAERVDKHGTVIAGEANDQVLTGQPIRVVGEMPDPMVRTVDLDGPRPADVTYDEWDSMQARRPDHN